MSLLDLKSDLSKYRAETSIEEKEGPHTSVAKSSKGFATNQPITDRLLTSIPEIKKPKQIPIDERLKQSKLDDIIRKDFDEMMINSVSGLSPKNIDVNTYNLGVSSIENVASKFGQIKQEEIVNNLNTSNTLIIKSQSGNNNNDSNVNPSQFTQTVNRTEQSPNIVVNVGDANDNIIVPEIIIDGKPLSMNRENQSVIINKNLISPINNVINPNIALNKIFKPSVKENTTPNIVKDTIKEGLVVDPQTKVFRIQSGTNHFTDESELNPKGKSIQFISTSMLDSRRPLQEPDLVRYSGETVQTRDNSIYNIDDVIRTNPSGRNENPDESLYSFDNAQGVNYFDNRYFRGFSINQKSTDLVNKYSSIFGFPGSRGTSPAVNFMVDTNATGFETFTQPRVSSYKNESSDYTFVTQRSVNFFDINGQHTNAGFTLFARALTSNYLDNVSRFTWKGKRPSAPSVNYFDVNKEKSVAGFHTFAQTYDTKFVKQASIYDWDGKRTGSPEVNYFDINSTYTKRGFHKLAELYDSKYVRGSSIFDWDGKRRNAPAVNYFDVDSKNSQTGFHTFAQKYDSKFVAESSEFDWDGVPTNAPAINYFDLNGQFTTTGFHTFAQTYDTKYIPETSRFDWNGVRRKAPSVNYFDLSKEFTTTGFHTFARKYDTKYIPESSVFDWDGTRDKAPVVDYFDLYATNTSTGFHSFAQLYDTKFIEESSIFDWDGTRVDAPEVNYFDISGVGRSNLESTSGFVAKTTAGFHKFAQIYDTKYVRGSSIYDWDGDKQSAPAVNYFDVSGTSRTASEQNSLLAQFNVPRRFTANTLGGFHTFAQKYDTKYITESSEYNWDGTRNNAPEVNYFDIAQTNRTISEFTGGFRSFTTAGFHKFAQLYDSKYIKDSSRYDWDGKADRKNFRNPIPVDYFDNPNANARRFGTQFIINTPNDYRAGIMTVGTKDKFIAKTFGGFHIFAQLYDSKYIPESSRFDWDGTKDRAPSVNYFDTFQSNRTTSEENSLLADFNRPKQFIASTTAGFHIFAQKYDTKYIKYASLYDWDGVPDKTNFRNPVPVDYFDTFESNRTTSEENSLLANFNRSKDFIAKTTAGFHIFAQKYDTKYIKDASIYDWDGRADRRNFTNPIAVDFFDNIGSVSDYRRRSNVGGENFLDGAGSVNGYNTRSNIGGFAFLKQIGTKDKFVQKTLSGFDIFPEHYVTRYIHGASRFDWDGPRQDAPAVDFMDTVASGDVFIKNTLGGGDYLRGIIALGNLPVRTFQGGNKSRLDYSLSGYTHSGFTTFAQIYDTQYTFKVDRFGWVGGVDRIGLSNPIPVNFFDNHVTISNGSDSVAYDNESRPGTVPSQATVINGQRRGYGEINPGSILFQLGKISTKDQFIAKTTAGFHILAQRYDSKYVWDSSVFDWDGTKLNAPTVNYFNDRYGDGFRKFAIELVSDLKPDSGRFNWAGSRPDAPAVSYFPQLQPKTDHARKIAIFSNQTEPTSPVITKGEDAVVPPELFKKSGLSPGFRRFFINKTQTAYSPYLSEFSVLATANPYTNFFQAPNGYRLSGLTSNANGLEATDPSTLGMVTGLLTGIGGFIPYLGSLNRPTKDPSVTELGIGDYVSGDNINSFDRSLYDLMKTLGGKQKYSSSVVKRSSIRTKTLGSNLSLIDADIKNTTFFSWGKWPVAKDKGFLRNMSLFKGTLYPIIFEHFDNRDRPDVVFEDTIGSINLINILGVPGGDVTRTNTITYGTSTNLKVEHGRGDVQSGIDTNTYGFTQGLKGQAFLDALLPHSLGKRPWSSAIGNSLYSTLQNQYPIYTFDANSRFYGYRRPSNSNPAEPVLDNVDQFGAKFADVSIWRTGAGGPYEKMLKNGFWVQPQNVNNSDQIQPGAVKTRPGYHGTKGYERFGKGGDSETGFFRIDQNSENLVRQYGYIGRWALQTGELDKQYKKFDLREDAYNPDLFWSQPYYVSDIGANWGWGALACGRMSPTTQLDRRLADLQRIAKFMTSGKGLLWTLKQFGMQFMNPFVDTWNEPFDLFEQRSYTDNGSTRNISVVNNSVLPNVFNTTGTENAQYSGPSIFMPPPTLLYNPLSTLISAIGMGIGLRRQRHWSSSGFGFGGAHQWVPNYREQVATATLDLSAGPSTGLLGGLFSGPGTAANPNATEISRTAFQNPLANRPNLGNLTGDPSANRRIPDDLNRGYEAQTTYRNKTGFINQNIGGIDYKEKLFHKKLNGDWEIPAPDQSQWYSLQNETPGDGRGSAAGSPVASGRGESLNYFEAPRRTDSVTRQRRYNRLIGLMKELLPQSFSPNLVYDRESRTGTTASPPDTKSDLRSSASARLMATHKARLSDAEIVRLSSTFGGPGSFFGIGGTSINKSRHKLLGAYTTTPLLNKDLVEEGKQRETFFALDFYATYKDRLLKLKPTITGTVTSPSGEGLNELGGDLYAITKGLNTRDLGRNGGIYNTNPLKDPNDPNNPIVGENITIQPITARKLNAIGGVRNASSGDFLFSYERSENRLRNSTIEELRRFRGQTTPMNVPDTAIKDLNVSPIKQFSVSNYLHKNKFDSTSTARPTSGPTTWLNPSWTPNRTKNFNDFRWDVEDINTTYAPPDSPRSSGGWNSLISMKFSTHPAIVDYRTNNLEDKFGLGKQGAPGSDRGNPRVTNILHNKVQSVITTIPSAVNASLTSNPGQYRTYPVPTVKAAGAAPNQSYQFRGDRINIIDYKRANFPINSNLVYEKGSFNNPNLPGTDDLIEFYFSSIVLDGHNYCPAEVIVFRAVFDSITDNHKPTWNAVKYMGRGDPLYTYDGYERDVSFNFTVHIGSRDEMKASWRKLNYLAGYTAPEYTRSGYIRAPLCRLNIGNLFKKMPGYISSLSYTFDNVNGTWETAHLEGDRYNVSTAASIREESRPGVLQLPKTIQVACSFVPIGVYRPEKYGVFYPLYDDRNDSDSAIETGLIPDNMNRVNWFNPFDNIAMASRTNVVVPPNVPVTAQTPPPGGVGPVMPNTQAGAANQPAPTVTTSVSGDQDVIDALAIAPGEEDFVSPQQNPAVQPP